MLLHVTDLKKKRERHAIHYCVSRFSDHFDNIVRGRSFSHALFSLIK